LKSSATRHSSDVGAKAIAGGAGRGGFAGGGVGGDELHAAATIAVTATITRRMPSG
jgi:hypothetical protein